MTQIIINDIAFQPDLEQLLQRLHVRKGSSSASELSHFVEQAQSLARPKVLYQACPIEKVSANEISINGVTLTSRVLRVNLDPVDVAYPFIATCGTELDSWSSTMTDFLTRFWAEAIKEQALICALQAFDLHFFTNVLPGHSAMMNPGSLEDWPLTQQKPLFAILGDPFASIGVQLSDSYLMIPNKTVSGIRFASEATFESCQLCPRENCPNRRASYDENLFANRYQMAS